MDHSLRTRFNQEFSEDKYQAFLKDIHPAYDLELDFRIGESPIFVDKPFKQEIMNLFNEIKEVITAPGFSEKMEGAIPENCYVPNEDSHPTFVAIDFAVCKGEDGNFLPQLIEMQGIASLYCYQHHLCKAYLNNYESIPKNYTYFFNGIDTKEYIDALKRAVIGDENPDHVVLIDIEPKKQKTRIDFHYTEEDLGIKVICITDLIKEGKQLFYMLDGKKTLIKRIYNRVIFDELHLRTDLDLSFDMVSPVELDRWMAHPNWFFKISKYTMPFIDSKYVPKSYFLHELESYPSDLENYVLKPLFSFAGAGVVLDVTAEMLDAIEEKSHFLLQRKVEYVPCIKTLDTPAKAEIRLLCLWDEELKPMIALARLSKGKMIGVDFNKEKTWVGSSAVFFEED